MTDQHLTRREVLRGVPAFRGDQESDGRFSQAPAPGAPAPAPTPPPARGRGGVVLAPRADLVNILEYEEQSARVLPPPMHAVIAGGDRAPFDRITLRPRMNIPTTNLDLTTTLFGEEMFTPILIGPIADQQRFHPDGELATARAAAAARATMVVSSRRSVAIEKLKETSASLWGQAFLADPAPQAAIEDAVAAGCKAICVTVGALPGSTPTSRNASRAPITWPKFTTIKKSTKVPVLAKGISSVESAKAAIGAGADGLVVSNYGGLAGDGSLPLILNLAAIVEATAGRVPVLIDGSFRRGTDILKALAFGATAVMIGRPVMWGLAAYGTEGAQGVVERLQTELARYMAMTGRVNIKSIDATVAKVHGVQK